MREAVSRKDDLREQTGEFGAFFHSLRHAFEEAVQLFLGIL